MDEESLARAPEAGFKVGVKIGGGPPPGYRWNVYILDHAYEEAMGFLNHDQYEHLAQQVRWLAAEAHPTRCDTVDIRQVEDFWEIRDKGGILGKINVRVFFCLDPGSRSMAILSVIKKEVEGQTPRGVKVTVRRRMRLYLESLQREK